MKTKVANSYHAPEKHKSTAQKNEKAAQSSSRFQRDAQRSEQTYLMERAEALQ
jgi:hypothetical protein